MDLETQVIELLALHAAYPGSLTFTPRETRALQAACLACGQECPPELALPGSGLSQATGHEDESAAEELSGSCEVPDVTLGGQPVTLHFHLPVGYPTEEACDLSVTATAGRQALEELNHCVTTLATQHGEEGACCLLTAVQELKEHVLALASPEPAHHIHGAAGELEMGHTDDTTGTQCNGSTEPTTNMATVSAAPQLPVMSRTLIWFHHIKSITKRKIIVSEARRLDLGGASKPGFPGVVVVEGCKSDVEDFVSRVRALSWQAMQVRGVQDETLGATNPPEDQTSAQGSCNSNPTPSNSKGLCGTLAGSAGSQAQHNSAQQHNGPQQNWPRQQKQASPQALIDQARRLPRPFQELPETGMSELGAMCRDAGLHELFMTALKL